MKVRATHLGVVDGSPFLVDGINLWDHPWEPIAGETVHTRDPAEREVTLPVYRITDGAVTIRFASLEISAGVWAFYLPEAHDGRTP
jgi:hypothetical protein